jgi:hypothetical protein
MIGWNLLLTHPFWLCFAAFAFILPLSLHFPLAYISQMTSADIHPPPGGGYFPIYGYTPVFPSYPSHLSLTWRASYCPRLPIVLINRWHNNAERLIIRLLEGIQLWPFFSRDESSSSSSESEDDDKYKKSKKKAPEKTASARKVGPKRRKHDSSSSEEERKKRRKKGKAASSSSSSSDSSDSD